MVERGMFSGVDAAKPVTVQVPGNVAWETIISGSPYSGNDNTGNWGNAFRGGGWDGTGYLDGEVNANISLTIEEIL
jgi:hypothetical protein